MASRIVYTGDQEPTRQRQPRRKDEGYLDFVRKLSCPICGAKPVDPAHLRTANRLLGKRPVGVGEKNDDQYVLPLCRSHHDVQHGMNELEFWRSHNISNPFQFALALFACYVSKDMERAETVVAEHRLLAMGIG